MNADAFRHFYGYHFSENRKLWDSYITSLSQEQFTQDVGYSIGSVRNQIVHLMSVDDAWFSGLRGVEIPESLDPADFEDRKVIRAHWDTVEQNMRDYLEACGTICYSKNRSPKEKTKTLSCGRCFSTSSIMVPIIAHRFFER